MWNGKNCADVLGLLRKKFQCDCKPAEEFRHTWLSFQQARWKSACPMADFPAYTPQHGQTLPPSSIHVKWQPSPSTLPPSIVQAPSDATPAAALRQLPPAIVQPPFPPTPPDTDIDASISQASQPIVAEAPGSEPQFKRARLNSICNQQHDSLQCQGGQPLQCVDEGTAMSEAGQQYFMLALSRATQSLGEGFESVRSVMIRLEQWELLKAIQGSVDLVHECLSQKHAGEIGCWKSSTALKTITRVCQAFEATPLLKETIAHLQNGAHLHRRIMCMAFYWSSPNLGIASGRFRSNSWYKWSNGKSCRDSLVPGSLC